MGSSELPTDGNVIIRDVTFGASPAVKQEDESEEQELKSAFRPAVSTEYIDAMQKGVLKKEVRFIWIF